MVSQSRGRAAEMEISSRFIRGPRGREDAGGNQLLAGQASRRGRSAIQIGCVHLSCRITHRRSASLRYSRDYISTTRTNSHPRPVPTLAPCPVAAGTPPPPPALAKMQPAPRGRGGGPPLPEPLVDNAQGALRARAGGPPLSGVSSSKPLRATLARHRPRHYVCLNSL